VIIFHSDDSDKMRSNRRTVWEQYDGLGLITYSDVSVGQH